MGDIIEFGEIDLETTDAVVPSVAVEAGLAPFLDLLWDTFEQRNLRADTHSWTPDGQTIVIVDKQRFMEQVWNPEHVKTGKKPIKWDSFQRQVCRTIEPPSLCLRRARRLRPRAKVPIRCRIRPCSARAFRAHAAAVR